MKRGNTALKRGVGLASAFALAIAGAVIAAPAASAALAAPDQIRATPIADAPLITASGAIAATAADYNAGNVYGTAGITTGALPTLSAGNGQSASGIQVFIPGTAGDAFDGGESFVITLNNGAKFSAGSASISGPFLATDLDSKAGYSNPTKTLNITTATVPALSSGAVAVNPSWVSAAVQSDGSLKVSFAAGKSDPNTGLGSSDGYLVSINGVKVDIPNDAAPGALNATTNSVLTTIGYISPFSVKAADGGYTTLSTGDVKLPDVTVTENSKQGFSAVTGPPSLQPSTLTVSGEAAVSTDPEFNNAAGSITATPTSTLGLNSATPGTAVKNTAGVTGADMTVNTTTVDTTRLTSYSLSGLVVDSNLKKGADVTLELTAPTQVATTTGASTWSASPDQTAYPSVTISASTAVPRLAGANRYDTAAKVAAEYVDANGSAGYSVVLANGTDAKLGIDALAANFLAGAKDAPILLTDSSSALPKETQDALKALFDNAAGDADGAVTIYIMGKTDSVSQAAEDQAVSIVKAAVNAVVSKVNVVRIDGSNRYETSAKALSTAGAAAVSQYNIGAGYLRTAFLASGVSNADALSAGALSSGAGIPVLLADGDAATESVAKVISDLNIKQLIVLGGTDRISDKAIDALKADHGVTNVVRLAGVGSFGRYDTAAQLNDFAFVASTGLGLTADDTAYLASGSGGFADALTVGPLAGLDTSALLTVPQNLLPDTTRLFLRSVGASGSGDVFGVLALGQSDRIADSVVTAAQAAIK